MTDASPHQHSSAPPKTASERSHHAWAITAMATFGLSGLLINILIGRYCGKEILGGFNQILAIYLVITQLTSGGLHLSTLRLAGQHADHPRQLYASLSAALCAGAILGLIGAALTLSLALPLGTVLGSNYVTHSLAFCLPGILFFSLNKILMCHFNGLGRMPQYWALYGARSILITFFVILILGLGIDPIYLPAAFSAAEALVFLTAIALLLASGFKPTRFTKTLLAKHADFAAKVFGSAIFLDLNPRIDVLMVGVFMDDATVGIYSIAALLGEGLYTLAATIQVNATPVISKYLREDAASQIKSYRKSLEKYLCPAIFLISAVIFFAYPFVISGITGDQSFTDGRIPFAIISISIGLTSGYISLGMLLNQAGQPWAFTIQTALVGLVNVMLNLALIPLWGIYGAALATASAYLVQAALLKIFAAKLVRTSI